MSIYAISDLHLAFGKNKPMEIFGENWKNHYEKIKEDWIKKVKQEDVVLLPGDFSWAINLDDSLDELKYLENLPRKKSIIKGKS